MSVITLNDYFPGTNFTIAGHCETTEVSLNFEENCYFMFTVCDCRGFPTCGWTGHREFY